MIQCAQTPISNSTHPSKNEKKIFPKHTHKKFGLSPDEPQYSADTELKDLF
jgi:hypothetical protein